MGVTSFFPFFYLKFSIIRLILGKLSCLWSEGDSEEGDGDLESL